MKHFNLFVILSLPFFAATVDVDRIPFYKGMTVSCQTWGVEWASPEMKATMNELKTLGVNAIAIHPYARINEAGQVKFRRNVIYHIVTPIRWAKELGQQFIVKPHLAYWGTRFRWRGDINFENSDQWNLFFSTYKEWVIMIAAIAAEYQADILCIGTEYRHSLQFDSAWRDIIDAVREVYNGKITYAANWDTYDKVTFWDDLDYIGIQAYFPLVDSESPSETDLIKAWQGIYDEIIPYAQKHNRKIVFTEIGYNTSTDAARIPWTSRTSQTQAAPFGCKKNALKWRLN